MIIHLATVITNLFIAIPCIGKLFQFDISNNKINKVVKYKVILIFENKSKYN